MNKDDIYNNKLKEVFSNFEADIPNDGWDRLEQSLNARNRATIIRRNWYIGSVAATVVILISSILFINKPTPLTQENSNISKSENINSNKSNLIYKDSISFISNNEETASIAKTNFANIKTNKLRKEYTSIIESHIKEISTTQSEDIDISSYIDNKSDSELNKSNNASKLSQEEIDSIIKELKETGNTNIFDEPTYVGKKDKPLELAINAKSGLTSSQRTSNSPMSLRSANTYNSPQNNNLSDVDSPNDLITDGKGSLITNNYSSNNVAEMIHSQPYSIGITISKSIIDRLYLETGIMYTYLYSESKNTSSNHKDKEVQEIHYLGIPLSLNYRFLEIGNFNLYATIGGAIEKDIYGVNSYNASSTNQNLNAKSEKKNSDKINLKNPQLSINTGIGASYNIYDRVNIYAKIGGAYYFEAKNNEYKTIYSDKKILLDLNAGIRFDF